MKTCTFFGDKRADRETFESLLQAMRDAIEQENIRNFYVGDRGAFDGMVITALRILKQEHPEITYAIVLYAEPVDQEELSPQFSEESFLPEELRAVPLAYAIDYRNRWMAQHADMVICYLHKEVGEAARGVRFAKRRSLKIRNLADRPQNI